MNTLVIESSTRRPSLALFDGDTCVAERAWEEQGRGGRVLFQEMRALLQDSGCHLSEVGRFVCGRGPGIFSSLRMAITAVNAAALPGQAEVVALSSGEGLAWELIDAGNAETVAVAGDARRDRAWLGLFQGRGGDFSCVLDWCLVTPSSLVGLLPAGTLLVSPEWDRLSALLPSHALDDLAHEARDQTPTARGLGIRAMHRLAHGVPSDPLEPLYMHPPVQAPKNDASC